jgi:NhaA family Na+:H+ antiporter
VQNRSARRPALAAIREFLNSSAAGGIVLMMAAALALIIANLPVSQLYFDVLHVELGGLSLLHWINDGLMTVFFLMVGLEIKREVLAGQLATWPQRILPGVAAMGGMLVPALVYLFFNLGSDGHPRGWAVPSATDIAFALGVLSLLGPRVPLSLKVFLAALAIIDDLGAVIIIALFYTASLNLLALGGAALVLAALAALNRFRIANLWPYAVLGVVLWFLVLQSGVHATLAGVALALCVPLHGTKAAKPPLETLEHVIAPWVTFLIVPVFGFANAGVSFGGMTPAALLDPVPLGVALGLFVGKQVGVFGAAALVIRLGWAQLPQHANWAQLYGVALLCGIGFTMSLFISLLAFPDSVLLQDEVKLGVLLGSGASALAGALLLRNLGKVPARQAD